MAFLISDSHAGCILTFKDLINTTQHPVRNFGDQIPLEDVKEEFSKYKVWAGNVGAAHSGKRYEISLDYRLREASFLRDQVLSLMKVLKENLKNATLLVRGKRTPFEEHVDDSEEATSSSSSSEANEEEEDAEDSPWDISSSSSGDSTGSQGVKQHAACSDPTLGPIAKLSQTPLQEMPRLLASIKFVISCLYRIPIRRPAPLDRLKDRTILESSGRDGRSGVSANGGRR